MNKTSQAWAGLNIRHQPRDVLEHLLRWAVQDIAEMTRPVEVPHWRCQCLGTNTLIILEVGDRRYMMWLKYWRVHTGMRERLESALAVLGAQI